MKLKAILVCLLLLIGSTVGLSQDFTLSKQTSSHMGNLVYTGSFVITGDSVTIFHQGKWDSYIKDIIATDSLIVEDQVAFATDSLNFSVIEPNFIRVAATDSVETQYSNYIDITPYDPGSIVVVTKIEELVENTTNTVYIDVYGLKFKANIPTIFINSR